MPTHDAKTGGSTRPGNSPFQNLMRSAALYALAVSISVPSLKADVFSYAYDAAGNLVSVSVAPGSPAIPPGGINPTADTDGDGVTDYQEIALGTNPSAVDSDGDGLTDGQEVTLGTNPLSADTDGDGITDGWEVAHGSNPLLRTAL